MDQNGDLNQSANGAAKFARKIAKNIFTSQQGTLASISRWFGKQSFKSPNMLFSDYAFLLLVVLAMSARLKLSSIGTISTGVIQTKFFKKNSQRNNIVNNNPANPQGKKKRKLQKNKTGITHNQRLSTGEQASLSEGVVTAFRVH